MSKYCGFTDYKDLRQQFEIRDDDASFPKARDIIIAVYETEPYEGTAMVLFEQDGKLFEVHASHCSCMGLEGQWGAEETTWEALKMRQPGYMLLAPVAELVRKRRKL
jgi:hypothetical protein